MLIWILLTTLAVFGANDIASEEELRRSNAKLKQIQEDLIRLLHNTIEEDFTDDGSAAETYSQGPRLIKDAPKPNILFFLADDYGWANVGYHNNNGEIDTPAINKLVSEGVELDRFYTFNQCGPSRAALLSGRNAMHVNYRNNGAMAWNPENKVSGYGGVPPNMTLMGTKMKEAGYQTAYTGKWDVGFASTAQMPYPNGFDQFFGYLQHANSYCSTKTPFQAVGAVDVCQSRFFDLWSMDADGHKPSPLAGTAYEEELFLKQSLNVIENHNADEPLFLFHAAHFMHTPLQIPDIWIENFTDPESAHYIPINGRSDSFRRQYAAMTQYMDDQIRQLVKALKEKGMWENTLFVFMSDNGGPLYTPAAANNYPHRGGKLTDFEGGIRVNAFVSGGFIPEENRGTKVEEFGYVADWYTTFCNLAGVDIIDKKATKSNELHCEDENSLKQEDKNNCLPPVDGVDLWPLITENKKVRDEIFISEKAIIMGDYKLMIGKHGYDVRTGPKYPNNTCACSEYPQNGMCDCPQPGPSSGYWFPCETTDPKDPNVCFDSARGLESFARFESYPRELEHLARFATDCSKGDKVGCLYNIVKDPEERMDLTLMRGAGSDYYQDLAKQMLARLRELKRKSIWDPERGGEHYIACIAGFYYGGYLGPFLDEHGEPLWEANSETQAAPSCDACEVNSAWPVEQEERCVHYPDSVQGFRCTPYVNGQCSDPPQVPEPLIVGRNAPRDAKFLCGSKTRSWAHIPEQTEEFYYVETAEIDLAQHKSFTAALGSMAAPFPDVCPLMGVRQQDSPVNIRRN